MMADAFQSPKRSIRHAIEEIEDAERLAVEHFGRSISRVIEIDRATGEQVHKLRLAAPLPDKIEMILKDAIGSLRDALDHAVYSATRILNGGDPKQTGFPFAQDAVGVEGQLKGRYRGNAEELRALLTSMEPHEGDNSLLWALNSVRNPGTHRFIVPVGAAVMMGGLSISSGTFYGGEIGYSRWDAVKLEVEFMRVHPKSNVNYRISPAFHLAFEGDHALRSKPVFETLRRIAGEVERAVASIETETMRILAERA